MIKYSFSSVAVASSNISVGPLQIMKISFFLLLSCTEELFSTAYDITFLPNPLPPENGKASRISNPKAYPKEY